MQPLLFEASQLPQHILPEPLSARVREALSEEEAWGRAWSAALSTREPFPPRHEHDLLLLDQLSPFVFGYRCETVLSAFALEMGPRTTIRQALAFSIVALAHARGEAISVSQAVARGPKGSNEKDLLEGFRENYQSLTAQRLLVESRSPVDDRLVLLRLSETGRALFEKVCRRLVEPL